MSDLRQHIDMLRQVLRSENKQLKEGRYTDLHATVETKQSLLAHLSELTGNVEIPQSKRLIAKELSDLQHLLKENERLMRLAMNTVKFAYKQIAGIKHTEKKVGAYNRFGKTLYIQDAPGLKTKMV